MSRLRRADFQSITHPCSYPYRPDPSCSAGKRTEERRLLGLSPASDEAQARQARTEGCQRPSQLSASGCTSGSTGRDHVQDPFSHCPTTGRSSLQFSSKRERDGGNPEHVARGQRGKPKDCHQRHHCSYKCSGSRSRICPPPLARPVDSIRTPSSYCRFQQLAAGCTAKRH